MANSIEITGIQETTRKLFAFSSKLGGRVTSLALRSGANFMLKNMRAAAPKKTGRLRRSITVKNSRINQPRKNGKVGVYIKLNPGKSRTDQKGAWYWLFVEADHYNHGRAGRDRPANASKKAGYYFVSNTYKRTARQSTELIIKDIDIAGEKLAGQI